MTGLPDGAKFRRAWIAEAVRRNQKPWSTGAIMAERLLAKTDPALPEDVIVDRLVQLWPAHAAKSAVATREDLVLLLDVVRERAATDQPQNATRPRSGDRAPGNTGVRVRGFDAPTRRGAAFSVAPRQFAVETVAGQDVSIREVGEGGVSIQEAFQRAKRAAGWAAEAALVHDSPQ